MPTTVLPQRLADEDQAKVDQAWNDALTPIDRHGAEELLDILVLTQAYQAGVDSLHLRSEKEWARGIVVMEIHVNRKTPETDRFTVEIRDKAGTVLRRESYARATVEATVRLLTSEWSMLDQKRKQGNITPDELRTLEHLESRRAVV